MGADHEHNWQDGFTLIELSILLVIIGLIVGGVLAGHSLIRAAELQSVITDEKKLITAVYTFKIKYGALPGDMPNATNYWGTNPNGCPSSNHTAQIQATCNGDGNGTIGDYDSLGFAAPAAYETYYAWQHLADAGLIQGAYTGTSGPAAYFDVETNINVPASKLPNGGYQWMAFSASSYNLSWFMNPAVNTQFIQFGAQGAPGDLNTPLLTGQDAAFLDRKVDDGMPGTGLITGTNSTYGDQPPDYTGCSTSNNITTATYNVAINKPTCLLLFQAGF